MSRRESRLRAVQRVREIRERQERARLAQADGEMRDAHESLEDRRARGVPQPPQERMSPLALRVLALQGVRSVELIEEAAAEYERTQMHRAEVHSDWSRASVAKKSVDRLEERQRTEAALQARQAAERSLDELVILRRGWQR